MGRSSLTPKMRAFVDEFVIDFNGAAAARRAGYSAKTARAIAAENLTKPDIQEAIRKKLSERAEDCEIKSERVLKELAAIAFSDVGNVIDFTGTEYRFRSPVTVPESARRSIASLKLKRLAGGDESEPAEVLEIKFWDKVDALRQLAQHLGLLNELQGLLMRLELVENGQVGGGAGAGGGAKDQGAGAAR